MNPAPVSRLADTAAIVDVLLRYATALDERRWALLDEVFTPDAVGVYGGRIGRTLHGLPAIRELVRGALSGLESSQHLLGNPVVALDGDRATSRCQLHAQHYLPGLSTGGSTFEVGGVYADRLVRTAGGWRIEHRRLDVLWSKGNVGVQLESGRRSRGADDRTSR